MYAHDILLGGGHQPQGVCFTQVVFFGEGKLFKILRGGDSCDPCLLKLFPVEDFGFSERLDLMVYLTDL